MPRKNTVRAWKVFDYALCKTATAAFNTIQFFNAWIKPAPSFIPAWSDKPSIELAGSKDRRVWSVP